MTQSLVNIRLLHAMQHRCNLTKRVRICLPTSSNNHPSFSLTEKISLAQQLEKRPKTGIVLEPFDANYAERTDSTLHVLFGVPKPDVSTRPILNVSDETIFNHSINDVINPRLCTREHY